MVSQRENDHRCWQLDRILTYYFFNVGVFARQLVDQIQGHSTMSSFAAISQNYVSVWCVKNQEIDLPWLEILLVPNQFHLAPQTHGQELCLTHQTQVPLLMKAHLLTVPLLKALITAHPQWMAHPSQFFLEAHVVLLVHYHSFRMMQSLSPKFYCKEKGKKSSKLPRPFCMMPF